MEALRQTPLLTLVICLLCTGISGQNPELSRYTCLIEFLPFEKFERAAGAAFDEQGVLMEDKQYHPLHIIQYGILCYYKYIDTGDTACLNKFISQVNYLKDPVKQDHFHGGRSVGLPYTFDYKDMKAPWYSGMTQGSAISLLLRYYSWSGDPAVRPLIRKICHFMITPVDKGGCLSTTPENLAWIEEYPGSEISPRVLNGFLNAWIGLYEYCLFFPDDQQATVIRDKTYHTLKISLDKFESDYGALYNQIKVRVSKYYLKYQILEMEQLFHLTGEELFRKQMMLWSYLAYHMPDADKDTLTLVNNYDFSVPLQSAGISGKWSLDMEHFPAGKKKPYYAFIQSDVFTPGFPLKIFSKSASGGDAVIFYRCHADHKQLLTSHWKVYDNMILKNEEVLTFKRDNVNCQFLVFYDLNDPGFLLEEFRIQ